MCFILTAPATGASGAPSAPNTPHTAERQGPDALLREAEARRALAELFPHLQMVALRAVQGLFPLKARREMQRPPLH